MRNPAKESAKTIDQVISGVLRGDSFSAEISFVGVHHGKAW